MTLLDLLNRRLLSLPILFLLLGALLTLGYTLLVPPFQVPDEDRHFWRAYGISGGTFVARATTPIPASVLRLNARFPPFLEHSPDQRKVTFTELIRWLHEALRPEFNVGKPNAAADVYSFVPYMAAASAIRIGRAHEWSPLKLLYAARLANAVVYLGLFCLSMYVFPAFRLALLVIGLNPMSLHLAASISADALTLGFAVLFTSIVFRLAFDPAIRLVASRDVLTLAAVLVPLSLCKLTLWTATLVVLIPARKFRSIAASILLKGCVCGVAMFIAAGWQLLNARAFSLFQIFRAESGRSVAANTAFLFHHPLVFSGIAFETTFFNSWLWIREAIGVFGWLSIPLSDVHVLMYLVALVLSACIRLAPLQVEHWQRLTIGLLIAFSGLTLHLIMWTLDAPSILVEHNPWQWVTDQSIQGRYFLPMSAPALAFFGRLILPQDGLLIAGIIALTVIINALALTTISLFYA